MKDKIWQIIMSNKRKNGFETVYSGINTELKETKFFKKSNLEITINQISDLYTPIIEDIKKRIEFLNNMITQADINEIEFLERLLKKLEA